MCLIFTVVAAFVLYTATFHPARKKPVVGSAAMMFLTLVSYSGAITNGPAGKSLTALFVGTLAVGSIPEHSTDISAGPFAFSFFITHPTGILFFLNSFTNP